MLSFPHFCQVERFREYLEFAFKDHLCHSFADFTMLLTRLMCLQSFHAGVLTFQETVQVSRVIDFSILDWFFVSIDVFGHGWLACGSIFILKLTHLLLPVLPFEEISELLLHL